jgi:tRNA (mo5U34)-methyltransferase
MTQLHTSAEDILKSYPEWYHTIELAPGVYTPGRQPIAHWEKELANLQLPDLRGKSVLDIGAYDGYFSFAAERLGAARVVALDHYVWSADMTEYMKDWRTSQQTGTPLPPPHESRHWRPAELPGRRPFDAARQVLNSKVEAVVGDFMTIDPSSVGQFDVVLLLGVLYHLEEPLTAIRKLASLAAPGGLVVLETEAVEVAGLENEAFCEFFPGSELNNDPTNWWAPNAKALEGLCIGAGFSEVKVVSKRPRVRRSAAIKHLLLGSDKTYPKRRYRAIAHAKK